MPLNVDDITRSSARHTPIRRPRLVRAVLPLTPPAVAADPHAHPVCAVDGMPLFATVVGLRCPVCGAAGQTRRA